MTSEPQAPPRGDVAEALQVVGDVLRTLRALNHPDALRLTNAIDDLRHALQSRESPGTSVTREEIAKAMCGIICAECSERWAEDRSVERCEQCNDLRADAVLSLLSRSSSATTEAPDYAALYHELLYAVGNSYEGETRHATALRYLLEAERGTSAAVAAAEDVCPLHGEAGRSAEDIAAHKWLPNCLCPRYVKEGAK